MKKIRTIGASVLITGLLTGCTLPSGDELLAAPKPTTEYQTLQAEIETLLASGMTYASPTAGDYRSSVQLIDLDSDGVDEAIAFFRGASTATSNDFYIYCYKRLEGGNYVCTGSVQGKAAALHTVEYPAITPDGQRGLVVCWSLQEGGTNALTMCDFRENGAPRVLLETEYVALELADLDADGAKDLLLLTTDPIMGRVAQLYQYYLGKMKTTGTVPASAEAVSVERMTTGHIGAQQTAILAEQKTASGVGLITDLFVFTDHKLRNLAIGSEDMAVRSTYRPLSVYATDINGDGITELPRAVLMAGYSDAAALDAVFMLDWYVYYADGLPERVCTTYQNLSDGWSLWIDEAWYDYISAEKSTESGTNIVNFYEVVGDTKTLLFTIYSVSDLTYDRYAGQSEFVRLGQVAQSIYYVRMSPQASQSTEMVVDAQGVAERFFTMRQDWNNS